MKGKKGGMIIKMFMAMLFISLTVVSFFTIPASPNGFWAAYQFSPPSNDLTDLDKSQDLDSSMTDISCDINREGSCSDERANKFEKAFEFINNMVGGAYGGLITLMKTFGTAKTMTETAGTLMKIPPEITFIFKTLVLGIITIVTLLMIFKRSDNFTG